MVAVHVGLAILAGAVAVLIGVVGLAGAVGSRASRPWLDRLILVELGLIAIALLTGALLPLVGRGPADSLHLLYAGLTLVVLPIARFAAPSLGWDRRWWMTVAGTVLLIGLLVRLVQTG